MVSVDIDKFIPDMDPINAFILGVEIGKSEVSSSLIDTMDKYKLNLDKIAKREEELDRLKKENNDQFFKIRNILFDVCLSKLDKKVENIISDDLDGVVYSNYDHDYSCDDTHDEGW